MILVSLPPVHPVSASVAYFVKILTILEELTPEEKKAKAKALKAASKEPKKGALSSSY